MGVTLLVGLAAIAAAVIAGRVIFLKLFPAAVPLLGWLAGN